MNANDTLRRHRLCVALLLGAMTATLAQTAADWPTYLHDARRTGISPAAIEPGDMEPLWCYTSPAPLRPAWPGPAPRDMYNSPTVDNEDRLDIDSVMQVAVVGQSVLFGSSVEDSLKCLDITDGSTRWVFTTDGPVRFAPHVVDGRAYFGSDDGHIYCVSAADGSLLWDYRAAVSDYQVPSDGKMVSLWPNRSGVVVHEGTVYSGAGVFPAEGAVICALDAATGADTGDGRYRQRYTDMSLQGYVLASDRNVYFPGGRSGPWVFARLSGERFGQIGGGGGTYAVVTGDESVIYGPGKTSAVLEEFGGDKRDRLATFPGGKQIIIAGGMAYVNTRGTLLCLDRARHLELSRQIVAKSEQLRKLKAGTEEHSELTGEIADLQAEREECLRWQAESPEAGAMVMAGEYLVTGGVGRVAAYRAQDGRRVWSAEVDGTAKGLAAAAGRLFVSTDASLIYCFGPRP